MNFQQAITQAPGHSVKSVKCTVKRTVVRVATTGTDETIIYSIGSHGSMGVTGSFHNLCQLYPQYKLDQQQWVTNNK